MTFALMEIASVSGNCEEHLRAIFDTLEAAMASIDTERYEWIEGSDAWFTLDLVDLEDRTRRISYRIEPSA